MCYGETLNRYRFLYEMSSQLKISKTNGNLDNYFLIIMNVLLKIKTQWNFSMYNFKVLDQEHANVQFTTLIPCDTIYTGNSHSGCMYTAD